MAVPRILIPLRDLLKKVHVITTILGLRLQGLQAWGPHDGPARG